MKLFVFATAIFASLISVGSYASTFTFSSAGTFGPNEFNGRFSSPDGSYSYSFKFNQGSDSSEGAFGLNLYDLSYTLNGTKVISDGEGSISFLAGDPVISVCLDPDCQTDAGIRPDGFLYQLSAPLAMSTLLAGEYMPISESYYSMEVAFDTPVSSFLIAPVIATPEPSSLLLMGSGLVVAVGTARRRSLIAWILRSDTPRL